MTDTVHFLGTLVPIHYNVSIHNPPTIHWVEGGPVNIDARFTARITNSKVDVEITMNKYDPDQNALLHVRALDLSSAAVNLVSFSTGDAQYVLLDEFIDPSGLRGRLLFRDPRLANLCTAIDNTNFDQVLRLTIAEPELFLALNELIMANTFPHVAAVNCGRVIDGIRRMIAPGLDARSGFSVMQEALNISRPFQQWITDQAALPRHADRSFIEGRIAGEIVRRTWVLMNRFIEYRKGNNINLTPPMWGHLVHFPYP